jgi:hypothetical protein
MVEETALRIEFSPPPDEVGGSENAHFLWQVAVAKPVFG